MALNTKKHILPTLILAIFWSKVTLAACLSTDSGNNRVDLNLNGTKITLLGWEHIADQETELLANTLKRSVLGLDGTKSCEELKRDLESTIELTPSTFENYAAIVPQIEEFIRNHENAQIAIEMTPQELRGHYDGITRFNNRTSALRNSCNPDFQNDVQRILNVLYGPEYIVSQAETTPIFAVEDQDIKNENAKAFENPELDTFDFSNPSITDDGLMALDQIRQNIMAQVYPNGELLDRVVAFEDDLEKRKELRSQLDFSIQRGWQQIVGAYKRNNAIAEKLLENDNPKVLPIGFRHVGDLKEKLLQLCRQTSSTFQNSPEADQ